MKYAWSAAILVFEFSLIPAQADPFAWGQNAYGQLGDVRSLARTTDGKVFAGGYNLCGQVGDGTSTFHPQPMAVDTIGVPAGKTQTLTSRDQVPEGIAKSDWSSIRAAYEAGRHAFQRIEGGWQARNPGQQWTTKFDGRGFLAQPQDGGWSWGLELQSCGFEESQHAIGGTPVVKAEGQRLSYQWDGTVREWWVNDQRGLEHGFAVAERPGDERDGTDGPHPSPRSQDSQLSLTLRTRGTLHPHVSADSQSVLFQNAAGATVLHYTGLKVWDAAGKVLPSHFEAAGETGLRLLVDERGARYPLTIDPIAQQAYLKPAAVGTTQEIDRFGSSVAISGDTVVVGASGESSSTTGVNSTPNESVLASGAAYVFVRSAGVWAQQAYLKPAAVGTTQSDDNFGTSVAISGDTVVVGAPREDSSTTGINSTPNESVDGFGNPANSGAAYIFVRSASVWTQQAYLKPAAVGTTQAGDNFGYSVAVSGDTVVVGAVNEDSSTTGVNSTPNESAPTSGAACVFVRNAGVWTQQAYLKPVAVGTTQTIDEFGYSVAVSGDTVVVGAINEDSSTTGVNSTPNESASSAGAAYIFVRSAGVWAQQAYLKPSAVGTSQAGDQFGYSVAVSGVTVVVGAFAEDSSTTGVNSTPNESASDSGAAYVFVRSGGVWTQQAYLKPAAVGTTQASDYFGSSVAVSGDTVVVGANGEDSSTIGVNSTPNESASDSGAACVFARSAGVWTQQAYLKPAVIGTSQTSDRFGWSVAVSGGTVVVGAVNEDSSTTGVNSTPNESAVDAGAAYIFTGLGVPEIAVEQPPGTDLTNGAAVNFGATRTGADAVLTFNILNSGPGDLTGISAGITGADAGAFTLLSSPAGTLQGSGGNSAFSVRFAPLTPGPKTALLRILSNDSDESPFTLRLEGVGISPEIVVHNGNAAAPELTDGQAAAVDFGIVRQSFPQARAFTISNTGTAPLLVSKVTLPPGYTALDLPPLPATVAIAQSLVFRLRIDAAALGTFTGRVGIESDDLDESVFDFPVTGIVVTPEIAVHNGNAAAPELSDGQAAAVNYGKNVQGTPATRSFTIANTGTAALLVSSITVPPGYTALNVPVLPLTVGLNQAATFQVSLTTLAVGTHPGSVVIASDDLDEASFDFPLTGEVFIPDPVSSVVRTTTVLNRQTGLREQTIHISNGTTATVPAYNLIIRGLPAGVEVNNASEVRADGSVVVYIRQTMLPHSTQDIVLEYYSANRAPVEMNPQLSTEVVLNPPDLTAPGTNPGLTIDRIRQLTGGVMMIEFASTPGRSYQVQYSSDGTTWQKSLPPIRAAANRTQWTDRGLPRTDSHPAAHGTRFYRVALIP